MKPSTVKEALVSCIEARQPVFLWGSPGIGKSSIIRQVAEEKQLELIDIRAVLLDPVDLRGIPHVENGKTRWCTPSFFPTDKDSKGIIFLDELNAAPPLVQAACYQLILDRRLGEYELPEGWTILAAGNLDSDRAVTHRMPTPLANRFVHLSLEVDLEDWVKWALNEGIDTSVIAFIRFRPELLHQFNPKRDTKAFPSPRSWEFTSKVIKTNPNPTIEYDLISGTTGNGAAAEYLGFLKVFRKLPNPDLVLMNPDTVEVPTDPSTLYAICGALARKASDTNFDRLVTYYNRMPDEFSVLAMRDSVTANPDLVSTRAYIDWASKHSEVLI